MTEKLSADFQQDEGRGTRDGKNWDGEAPAEPRTMANGEWRVANGKTTASSEWRLANSFGWRCYCTAEKISAHQEMRPPVLPNFGGSGCCPTEKFRHGIAVHSDFSPNEFGAQKNSSSATG
jgi:hypothetical protein